MIQVNSITIHEFRGIRDLTLDFRGSNFAVCGPNGTGKSGVVDALEFGLTGSISRLTGEGKGEISLKHHAPHVDFRDNPEKARVSISLFLPTLGKDVTIERSVKNPSAPKVTPNEKPVLDALQEIAEHPEIVLSRRELIRYVLATPGDRAREVQELLRLDRVEQMRTGLQKIANSCDRQLSPLLTTVSHSSDHLLRALGISEMSVEKVLAAANAQRKLLELAPLTELTATTTLKDGLAAPTPVKSQTIPKAQCRADIQAARDLLAEIASTDISAQIAEAKEEAKSLSVNPASSIGISEDNFYKLGLTLVEKEECPFCNTSWDIEKLRAHIQKKVDKLQQFSIKRESLDKKLRPLSSLCRRVESGVKVLVRYGALAKPSLTMQAAADYVEQRRVAAIHLDAVLPFSSTITALNELPTIHAGVHDAIRELEAYVAALPDPNKRDAAREFLTVAQERLEVWRENKRKHKLAKDQAELSRKISDTYNVTSDKALVGLYASVEKKFAALYSFINRTDEEAFSAKLIPSLGKLGFDVDFYGRGFFPPGAYHSEGHQDGMGLCLYLALMSHLQGADFTFAVLDDVLMSVDTGHRREICALLKKEFPKTQFVLTTHDPVWLRHMKTEGLIGGKGGIQFRTWNVEQGPTLWRERDIWTEIDEHLNGNNVRAAAGLLRHYLEYYSAELCNRLRAPVTFRSDAQYQLGELFPAAIVQFRKLLKTAKESANSWNQPDVVKLLGERDTKFNQLVLATNAEQWQVNVAVHYNNWDNLIKEDFAPVTKAYGEMIDAFNCVECGELLRLSPERETPDSLRCDCGKTAFNLLKKN